MRGIEYCGHAGQWRVMKPPAMVNDPNDPENLDYPSRKDSRGD